MPNISRSKGNQRMKFGQFTEYNTRNIFPENSCAKYCGETTTRPFSEKSKLDTFLDQSEHLHSSFLLYILLYYQIILKII